MTEHRPVLIVANDAGGTGSVSSVVRNHVRELARRGPVILIAATLPEPLPPGVRGVAVEVPQHVWLHRFAHVPREILLALAIRRAARRVCRVQRVAALFVHSHALGALVGQHVTREFGIPWLLVVHADIHDRPAGTYDSRLTAFYRWVTPIAYRHADRILAISSHIAQIAARHGADPSRIRIVPNGISVAEIAPEGAIEAPVASGSWSDGAALALLFVGRLSPEKGVVDLLQACGQLASRSVPFRLTIIGDGPLRPSLEQQTEALGIQDAVEYLGWLPREQLWECYRRADVVCVPSLSEPQGLVVLEALISGTPVVASAVGGIPDMIHDGENGRLHPPGNPERLVECLGELANDPAKRMRLAINSRSSVEEAFAWSSVGKKLRSVLAEIDHTDATTRF